jgi:ABC-type Na+ efflux pump permease subunit
MRSFWLVAKHEYRGTVVRRGWVIMTIAIPVGMAALIALVILVEGMGADNRPIGYVDYSGTLDPGLSASLPDDSGHIQIRSFADEEQALAALEGEQIQALFVLPAEYPQTLHTDLYYLEEPPGGDAWRDFDDFVRVNLLSSMPAEMQELLLEGPDITVYDLASNREFSEKSIINVVLPFVATFFFIFATMS